MRRRRRSAAFGALLAVVLLSIGCDTFPNRVEVLSAPQGSGAVVKIAASDEAAPPFRRIAEVFASRKGLRFEIVQTQSAEIPGLLRSGAVDAGVTAAGLPPGPEGSGFSYVPFAHDAIVFLASNEAGVGSLTVDQIRRIFKGEITDWKEVGGKGGPIRTVDRPDVSIAYRALKDGLFQGGFPHPPRGLQMKSNESAVQAMRDLPGFVGYASMASATTGLVPGVLLAVDGMQPLFAGMGGKSYPARVEYGLLFRKNSPTGVRELADFLLSQDGWHELATQGLLPASKQLSMASCHCREREGTFDPARDKSALRGTFTLAVVPELGAIAQENRYVAITRRIADGLGVRARLLHLQSYRQVLTEFSEGRVDAAFVGSLVYGKLRRRLNAVPLARPETGGVSRYRGVIVVRRGSGLRTFANLKGRRLACVPDTSAGELFPRALVAAEGGSWPGYFSGVVKAPSHQSAIELVLSGAVDAAAVKDLVLKRAQASSTVARDDLAVLSTSDPFPENAFVVAGTIREADRAALRSMLLAMDREKGGKEALRNLGADRMVPTSDEDYAAMYALARKIRYPLDGDE